MNRENINTIILFIGLVLLQVIVLNNINFLGYINPFFYILFIFLYPMEKINNNYIIISFSLGLAIDFFSNTGGINAAATLFIAYIRIPMLKLVIGKREIDFSSMKINKMTFGRKYTFILILTFIHHLIVFGLEYFKWSSFGIILQKTVLTTIFTMILIMISFTFVSRK